MKGNTTYVVNVGKNNYFDNPKNSSINTPLPLAEFIYGMLDESGYLKEGTSIIDIGCGKGNLSKPYCNRSFDIHGIDAKRYRYHSTFLQENFLKVETSGYGNIPNPLILCNPPFNYGKEGLPAYVRTYFNTKGYKSKPLLPHIFLMKIFDTWGWGTKVVLFTPMGFLRNQRILTSGEFSERYRWISSSPAKITSILTVPMNIFAPAIVHSDILFWNMPKLKPHYMYKEL